LGRDAGIAYAVAVGVNVGIAAAADTRLGLERIEGTAIIVV